jgi:hypothetical protein
MCQYICQKIEIMKSKFLLLAFALLAFANITVVAAPKQPKTTGPATQLSLSGVVLDKESNEKLAGVTIQLESTDQKIYSNAKGEFTLDGITRGKYKVKINCISYQDKEVTVNITKSKNDKLKIVLNPILP